MNQVRSAGFFPDQERVNVELNGPGFSHHFQQNLNSLFRGQDLHHNPPYPTERPVDELDLITDSQLLLDCQNCLILLLNGKLLPELADELF
ncbi:hypothetical protein [Roseibacillus persicicus]|uniref:hypothetical protein n=1 Tax=Roseibacillus persicicus TaxID=454148 RepID=UPI001E5A6C91|nr:hypothetical protein [Roseibacillus persicicus]